jgi:hypothetical protein
MSALHDELTAGASSACKLCAFLDQHPATAWEWRLELANPVSIVGNTAVVKALRSRGVDIGEASVRRHRENHA